MGSRVARKTVTALVAAGLVLAWPAGLAVAHVSDDFGHLWSVHIKPRLADPGTINDVDNPVDWTKLKGVPGGFADRVDDGYEYAGLGLKRSIGGFGVPYFAINPEQTQRRVSGSCGSSRAINGVSETGGVSCSNGPAAYAGYDNDTGLICNDYCTEGSLSLPAGSWVVFAKIILRQTEGGLDEFSVECQLKSGSSLDVARSTLQEENYFETSTLPMQVVVTHSSSATASVICKDNDVGDVYGSYLKITAIRMGAISNVAMSS